MSRRTVLLIAIAAAAVVVAGLALPGVAGGAILLALAVVLAVLTTAVQTRPDLAVGLDPRNWALRVLVVLALAAIGFVKLFRH